MRGLEDLRRRDELAQRVTDTLHSDARVETVTLFGSLAGGKVDAFSDIDLLVHLKRGVADRDLWADLPTVLAPLGSAVHGWSFQALSTGQYGASFLFDDYPLFWGVDIGCVAEQPTDPSDLLSTHRWEQIYKVWLQAAKAVARSGERLRGVRALVEKHEHVPTVEGPDSAIEHLRVLLAAIERRKKARGDPYERLHARCVDLLEAMSDDR